MKRSIKKIKDYIDFFEGNAVDAEQPLDTNEISIITSELVGQILVRKTIDSQSLHPPLLENTLRYMDILLPAKAVWDYKASEPYDAESNPTPLRSSRWHIVYNDAEILSYNPNDYASLLLNGKIMVTSNTFSHNIALTPRVDDTFEISPDSIAAIDKRIANLEKEKQRIQAYLKHVWAGK